MVYFISKKLHFAIGWCIVLTIIYLSVSPDPPAPDFGVEYEDKFAHVMMYAGLTSWFASAMLRQHWLGLSISVFIFGTGLELYQHWLPYRTGTVADGIANTLGIVIGCLLAYAARRYLANRK